VKNIGLLVIIALVILALLFLLWWLFSRNKQRKLDEQRAEAASIRAGAEQRGSVLRGQEAFAEQADERAATARHEAEERARQAELSAREAQRVEEEARQHRDQLERSRLAHDAELRRADELDPDVEVDKDDPRPLPEDLDDDVRPLDETRTHTPVPAALSENAPGTEPDPELARDSGPESAHRSESGSWGTGAAVSGAGAAAVGSAYAATRGNVTDDEAATRLASGADFSDNDSHDVEDAEHSVSRGESGGSATEWDGDTDESSTDTGRTRSAYEGTRDDMTQDDMTQDNVTSDDDASTRDGSSGTDEHGTRGAASDDKAAMVTDVEDYASTEPLPAESARADEPDSLDRSEDEARRAADESSRDDLGQEGTASDGGAAMVTDVEDYASTEPLPAETDATDEPSSHAAADDARGSAHEGSLDDAARDDEPAEEDVASRDDTSASGDSEAVTTPAQGADAAEDGADGESEGGRGDATHWPDGTDRINPVDSDSDSDSGSGSGEQSGDEDSAEDGWSRRISSVEEIRDGGYGVGSAAPLEDRAQPADHPVQAYRDTNTYRVPGSEGYDSAEPDVWFYDEESARRAGFTPSQG
jgi:hypothetical protein